MSVDELIAALQAIRTSDEVGALPVASVHPDSGWAYAEPDLLMIIEAGADSCFQLRHVRLDVSIAI